MRVLVRSEVELPRALVDHLKKRRDDLCEILGQLVKLGLDNELPPEPTGPASDPDPIRRKAQAAEGLTHYFARGWYLSLAVSRLEQTHSELERELEELEAGL
jgi:hypothetical protein